MKIAFVSFVYPPSPRDGMVVYADNLTREPAKMGHEVHVITPRAAGLNEESGEDGLVIPHDKDQLSKAILHMLNDDEMRLKFGEKGKSLVREQFNWGKIAEQVENAYSGCLSSRS